MRKLVLQMMMTLDGFVADEQGKMDWAANDHAMIEAHTALAEGADAAIMGWHLYSNMAEYWPAVASSPDPSEAALAGQMTAMRKIVISTTEEKVEWNNVEQLLANDEAELVRKLQELKEEPGNYLVVYGGVQTAQTLVKHGLVDEYRLDVCPAALGSGQKLFVDRAELEFVGATPYASGAVTLTYRPKPVKPAAPAKPAAKLNGESVEFGSWSKILVVEDNEALADIYKQHMEMIGYICFVAHEGNEALAMIEKERPSLVLLDLMVPGVAGDQILRRMRASEWGKDIKVLVISNLNEEDAPAGLRSQGIEGYAVKANLTDDQLDQMVNKILEQLGEQSGAAPKAA